MYIYPCLFFVVPGMWGLKDLSQAQMVFKYRLDIRNVYHLAWYGNAAFVLILS